MLRDGILRAPALVCAAVSVAALAGCSSSGSALKSHVIPPPNGFRKSVESDAKNGKLSEKDFDTFVYDPHTGHVVDAYQATYDGVSTDDSMLVVVAQFKSAADAQQFNNLTRHNGPFKDSRADPAVGPRVYTVTGIPGAVEIDPTKPDSEDQTYDHAVAAVKGSRVMFIDYITKKKGPIPNLGRLALDQYDRL